MKNNRNLLKQLLLSLTISTLLLVENVSNAQVVIEKVGYVQRGTASYYPDNRNGTKTRSGEVYDMTDFTGAHQALAFNSLVKVTNLNNGKEVVIRINDRPYTRDRIVDLTLAAADAIGLTGNLSTDVKIEVLELNANAKKAWMKNHGMGMVSQEALVQRFPPENKLAASVPQKSNQPFQQVTGLKVLSLESFKQVGTYRLDGQPMKVSGYSVQVATYNDIASSVKTGNYFNNQLQFRHVYIQSGWTDGIKAYRVIVGLFNTLEEATFLKNLIEANGYKPLIRAHYH